MSSQIRLDPELDDKLLSRSAVENGRPILYVVEAGANSEQGVS